MIRVIGSFGVTASAVMMKITSTTTNSTRNAGSRRASRQAARLEAAT
jgi:hypothetical protein